MTRSVLVGAPSPLRVTDELRSAARSAAGGWLYVVDPHFDPRGDVPAHGLVGAWRIADDGTITSEFRGNPEYLPSPAARGWPAARDELDRTAQLAAAGYATLDDVAVAMLYDDVAYAVGEDGAPLPDGEGRIVAYSLTAERPDTLAAGATWHRSSGRELAVRNAGDALVLLNPGPWQAAIPAVELAARAGGEASGYLLAERIDEFLAGEIDGLALHEAFCGAQVFCQAGARPGFLAVDAGDQRVVPVFTTLVALARFAGQTAWFSAPGQDVLNMLPDGYDVVLDAGSAHAVRLRGDATERHEPPTGTDRG